MKKGMKQDGIATESVLFSVIPDRFQFITL